MRILDFLSTLFLIVAGLLGLFVGLLDLFGTDFESGPWRWLRGPVPLTLLIAALLSVALGVERFSRFAKIDRKLAVLSGGIEGLQVATADGVAKVIHSLGGMELVRFQTKEDFLDYVTRRLKESKRSAVDITAGYHAAATVQMAEASKEAYRKYREAIAIVSRKKTFVYREVVTFPPMRNFDRVRELVEQDLPAYHVRYYLLQREEPLALPGFLILDEEELIMIMPSTRELPLAIRHPDVVRVFQDYYELLWEKGIRLSKVSGERAAALRHLEEELRGCQGGSGNQLS